VADPADAIAPTTVDPVEPVIESLLTRCHFPPAGSAVTCAVSGGADSLALLVLAVGADLRVTVVHVDHGLRPGGGDEATRVAEAARRFGARFRAQQVELAPGPNLEARARAARYGVLPAAVLTGHTADDQAETVLLNVVRGAALDGLAGFRPGHRPLRDLRRAETHRLCQIVGLEPVVDASNHDPRFRRNRVRHELLPLLEAIAERDVVPVLARQAELIRSDVTVLEALASEVDPTDVRALAAAPEAIARRAIRGWLRRGAEQHPPSAASVDRVLVVVRGDAAACQIEGGRSVRRSRGRLTLG
jgi:tRNA(Ile)-lysidine synthase